jgi:hypothetical protein
MTRKKGREMNIPVAALLAFLPKRYRESFVPYDVPSSGALLGGILKMLAGLEVG